MPLDGVLRGRGFAWLRWVSSVGLLPGRVGSCLTCPKWPHQLATALSLLMPAHPVPVSSSTVSSAGLSTPAGLHQPCPRRAGGPRLLPEGEQGCRASRPGLYGTWSASFPAAHAWAAVWSPSPESSQEILQPPPTGYPSSQRGTCYSGLFSQKHGLILLRDVLEQQPGSQD